MASAFDPSVFIAAEERRRALATVASPLAAGDEHPLQAETPAFQPFIQAVAEPLATVAKIAAPGADSRFPWSAALARFVDADCPIGVRGDYWSELIEEAWSVSREWGDAAIAAGWTAIDLFGCNRDPEAGRVDNDGLIVSICRFRSPVVLMAIDSEAASLRCPRGSIMKHHRRDRPGSAFLWDAYPMTGGP